MNEAITNYLEKAKEAKEALSKIGREAIRDLFNGFFEQNPSVTAVAWSQYTPHFNDGDACYFGVHDPSLTIDDLEDVDCETLLNEFGGYEGEYEIDEDKTITFRSAWDLKEDTVLKTNLEKLAGVLCGDLEDVLLQVFGDHSKILVTRDGVYTSDHEHD